MSRARDLGIVSGVLEPGPLNAITDVAGIEIGHTTIDDGADLHTGVTAIVPRMLGPTRRTLPAGLAVGNGFGKLVGATQLTELGVIETPVLLTATLSAFRVADAVVTYMMSRYDDLTTVNPVVGETNDGYLSDIRRRPVTERHALDAIAAAAGGLPAEGCVGAGTGTAALGYKAGIGTASRVVETGGTTVTLGALVQSNFSGRLTVLGVPVPPEELVGADADLTVPPGNSVMIVLATDARVDARQLGRVARRGIFGLAPVGSDFSGGSGDYAIALSTADPSAPPLGDTGLDPLFHATLEAVGEAVLNSLLAAKTTTGFRGRTRHAVPHDALLARLGLA